MNPSDQTVAVALLGSGGAGIATAGEILLAAASRAGYYGRLTRSFGPQIRGGETAAFVVLGRSPNPPATECFDLVCALDWNNAERFSAELPVDSHSCIAAEAAAGEPPEAFGTAATVLPLREAARATGIRENVQLLAVVAGWLGLPLPCMLEALLARLPLSLDAEARDLLASRHATVRPEGLAALASPAEGGRRFSISGNEATGLGLLHGGIRVAAAYPITPATELLEWLAPHLEGLGGQLIQAEDELASINMAVGASFGGVPAMTATSGPGLSLMHEGIGLAVAAEVPVVVVNVQRGGPSTGLPTKSEQADLLCAIFGTHGDSPHVVLAPTGVEDCAPSAAWAVSLAEQLQVPVILQSEQALGQTRILCDPIDLPAPAAGRVRPGPEGPYARYADTPSGISPMSVPGDADRRYVADGLEHLEDGTPTTMADAHVRQTAKRRRKLETFDFGERILERMEPDTTPECVIIATGSLWQAARLAAERLSATGLPTRAVALRILAPAQPDALAALTAGVDRIVVVEQNDGAQLAAYLRGWWQLPAHAESIARPGPIPIGAGELVRRIQEGNGAAA